MGDQQQQYTCSHHMASSNPSQVDAAGNYYSCYSLPPQQQQQQQPATVRGSTRHGRHQCMTQEPVPSGGGGTKSVAHWRRTRDDLNLLTRTSWTDAGVAYAQIVKGKTSGNKAALWLRARLQCHLFHLGCSLHRHAGKVLFVGFLLLTAFCIGLKSAKLQTSVDKLWVEEGGRLERELDYVKRTLGDGSGSAQQLVLQTPKPEGQSVLKVSSLLVHLRAVRAATRVSVDLYDSSWTLKDLCYTPNFPTTDIHYIDQIFENILPCTIVTPLDCFWEGSKLLGPDFPVSVPHVGAMAVRWTNLYPKRLIQQMKQYQTNFPIDGLENTLKRAGITSAYQEKPCLDPMDPLCPETAPNKHSKQPPDVAGELTGGCYGFATKFMHWPEEVIMGGIRKNRSGHVLRAEALQTVIHLMGEKELFNYWDKHIKVYNVDWTQKKAKEILELWQAKFEEEVKKEMLVGNASRYNDVYTFSTASLDAMLQDFSEASVPRLVLGFLLMLVYACVALLRWSDGIKSQSGLGFAGVVLSAVSVAAGLGCCALLGLPFNAATTQILPFLALGLGVDDMFLLVYTYSECSSPNIPTQEQPGEVLKRAGNSILLTTACSACSFLAAAIIPVPALRTFSLQAAILTAFGGAAMLFLYPAIISLDVRRKNCGKLDIFCCFGGKSNSIQLGQVAPVVAKSPVHIVSFLDQSSKQVVTESVELVEDTCCDCGIPQEQCFSGIVGWFVKTHYAKFITQTFTKVLTLLLMLVALVGSIWGISKLQDGLDLTDLVPRGTNEHNFLRSQAQYFGFYDMSAVTQANFEYPTNQKLLYEYHEAFMQVSRVVKNDDGGLPEFWLPLFRDWLIGLQQAFDRDRAAGYITREDWNSNASSDAILAYKLLVQTGQVDNPVDRTQVDTTRLVDADGIISAKGFYSYLSAWASNDVMAYTASQANMRPEPRQWYHEPSEVELKVPKSAPLIYAQMPFQLKDMKETEDITATVEEIRLLSDRFRDRGLPNFPSGLPFTFWEQYVQLRTHLAIALAVALLAAGTAVLVLLIDPWAAMVFTVALAAIAFQLIGAMGWLGLRLSAVPAVIAVASVGVGVRFLAHILLGFVTSVGRRVRRIQMSLEYQAPHVVHGAFATLLGVAMLAFAEFDFVLKYFFYVLSTLVVIGLLNGLVFFPFLLMLIGPPAEVVPKDHGDRISTPSPEPSPPRERAPCVVRGPSTHHYSKRKSSTSSSQVRPSRAASELSLTTITEEPSSSHSAHEVVVQPQVTVETSCIPTNSNPLASSLSSTPSMSMVPVVTTVTTHTKVKVELHAPLQASLECDGHCERHKPVSTSSVTVCTGNPESEQSDGSGCESTRSSTSK